MFLWLILLGILTYVVVRRSVADVTRTPVWVLWLVMMTPAFVWTAWVVLKGDEQVPSLLLLIPFVACPVLYWTLVQVGRRPVRAGAKPQRDLAIASTPSAAAQPVVRPITQAEEADLKNCFPWSVYYLQNVEYRPQSLICRGQLRTNADVAYKTVNENVSRYFGDRFLVVFREDHHDKPFFALVPNPHAKTAKEEQFRLRPALALGLVAATLLTTTLAGFMILSRPSVAMPKDLTQFMTGLPYAISLLAILGTHEMGHFLATRLYRIRATLPYLIPVPPAGILPFGTFGAFIQIRSPIPNRKALFDVGIAGPLAGFVVAVPILIWGLMHSTPIALEKTSSLLNPNSFQPSGSLFLTVISKLSLGNQLALDPVAIAGCLGIIITALNLMPVGQLDGGHIVHAMFGQKNGARIGQVARFLVLALALVQTELLLWAILLFLMPVVDEPALNDVSELDGNRDLLGLLALGLLVLIILPAPQLLTRMLF
jgi:membrane-associated protease RseP (regulator of RpoE activity)